MEKSTPVEYMGHCILCDVLSRFEPGQVDRLSSGRIEAHCPNCTHSISVSASKWEPRSDSSRGAMKAITKTAVENAHEGSGYLISARTKVDVLRIEDDQAVIRGPGAFFNTEGQRDIPNVTLRVNLSSIEVKHYG